MKKRLPFTQHGWGNHFPFLARPGDILGHREGENQLPLMGLSKQAEVRFPFCNLAPQQECIDLKPSGWVSNQRPEKGTGKYGWLAVVARVSGHQFLRGLNLSLGYQTSKEGTSISQKVWSFLGKKQTPYPHTSTELTLKCFNMYFNGVLEMLAPSPALDLSLQPTKLAETHRQANSKGNLTRGGHHIDLNRGSGDISNKSWTSEQGPHSAFSECLI